ncbi:vacuolar import and degradation protein-domain-containing protein [Mucidula mucida]|nr:vacuolar import and degradation protein-domain-containing protein [Mucidula mucida]
MPSSESFNSDVACSSCTLAPCICRVGKDKLLAIPCLPTITIPPAAPPATQPRDHTNTLSLARPHSHTTAAPFLSPSPLTDITRLRVRSQPHYCLYAGAEFRGTQKSGRNSYDVTVTIVDVDFASSFLCGYLCIRGLTEDYPELTTYFDAEIIGSRYGFLTQNWGANEADDMRPHYTIPDRDRGAVFMRWKERFLVPDHRVQDINGASFAGFYYVCVDFNPQPPSPVVTSVSPTKSRTRRDSSVRRQATLAPTMSGFYYHQNSEPYQQLSLSHVPERCTSTFEFR